jgi:hypothetical protein
MLDQIAQLVRQYSEDVVVNNNSIPNEKNTEVMAEATKTITSGMQNMMAGGGLQDLIGMFTQQSGQGNGIAGLLRNPMVTMMIGHLISKLTGKLNLSTEQASQVSNQVVPNVLNDLMQRTASQAPEDDGFDLNDLIGSLSGNNGSFDFKQLIGQFTGSGGGSESFDLQDILNQVTRGAQEKRAAETSGSGGGLADLIKGLF